MKKIIYLFILLLFFPVLVSAANVGFVSSNIWISDNNPIEGDLVKIYSVIVNDDSRRFKGEIEFYDNDNLIGDSNFNLAGGESSQVISREWMAIYGEHKFKAAISNAYFENADGEQEVVDISVLSQVTDNIFVDVDTDSDGIPDNTEEELGTDPNNPDTDGDGEIDGQDPAPNNPNQFSGDDSDADNISDLVDTDLDNDGLYNWEEEEKGSDPLLYDTDHDGYSDKVDAFPVDPLKWQGIELDKIQNDEEQNQDELIINNQETTGTTKKGLKIDPETGMVLGEKIFKSDQSGNLVVSNTQVTKKQYINILTMVGLLGLFVVIFMAGFFLYRKKQLEDSEY